MNRKIRRLGPVVLLAGLGVVASGCGINTGLAGPNLEGGGVSFDPVVYTPTDVTLDQNGLVVTGPSIDPGGVTVDIPTLNTGNIWFSII